MKAAAQGRMEGRLVDEDVENAYVVVLVSVAVPLVAELKTRFAPLLVVHFEWRAKLRRQLLAANNHHDELANAA